jgi:hypothetical protein
MIRNISILSICLVFIMGSTLMAQNQYIGASKCKMCHNKTNKGDQYNKWAASAHANAWKNLASPKAIETGKKKGVTAPQTDAKCLKCHAPDATIAQEGVSCEACHGPGSAYKSMTIMKNKADAIKNGLVVPTEKTCTACHNSESPTFKGFNFAEYSAKIAHMMPK